jgi:hypothetical protein
MASRHHRIPLAAANDTSDEIERTVLMLTQVEIVADAKPWIDPRRATCDPWRGNGGRQQLAECLTSTARRPLGRLATLKANVRALVSERCGAEAIRTEVRIRLSRDARIRAASKDESIYGTRLVNQGGGVMAGFPRGR